MTPKEKAQELYNKFDAVWIPIYMVDEIIKANPTEKEGGIKMYTPSTKKWHVTREETVDYWQQVKEELKNM
jgi:hypothetical protein